MRIHSFRTMLLAAALPMIAATGAHAQSNTISILQEGRGNTLSVDQLDATGSSVEGLTIKPSSDTFTQVIKTTETVQVIDPETQETRDVQQTRTETRSLNLDVLGVSAARNESATQLGSNNSASVILGGDGGVARLLQGDSTSASSNRATISALGGSDANVGQLGSGNTATVNVRTGGLLGTILQDGDNNLAELNVTGAGASGIISQIGNSNNTSLNVTGTGTSATYTVQGVGTASVGPDGATVISNGATVQITQTPMAGF